VSQAGRAGVDAATARAVWVQLTQFAAYAFCKAHAAGYGALAYQSAYLKTHFPAEYAVGMLRNHAGMYPTWVHVEDLRRHGVTFLPPCVNESDVDATLARGGEVRVGLDRVFGLAQGAARRIVARRPYADLADLAARARPTPPELEHLILAGALDFTGRARPSLLLEARVGAQAFARAGAPAAAAVVGSSGATALDDAPALDLLPPHRAPVATPELPEFPLAERVRGECAATGLWFSGHPLEVFVPAAERAGALPAAQVPARVGGRARVVGMACASRRVETKRGEQMLFLTVADRSGLAECVLFPDAYRRFAAATHGAIVAAEGRVEETLGAAAVTVERVESVADALSPAAR
jgi:DNA polymerase III alpha subunit